MPVAAQSLVYGCISHVPISISYPPSITPIYLGCAQQNGGINLRDFAPEWVPHHPILGGSAGTFALKNYVLAQCPQATHVGLCQYRKFMARHRVGSQDGKYQLMDVLPRAQLQGLDLAHVMLDDLDDFLFSPPGQFAMNGRNFDYLYQYKDVHHVQDLLRVTAEAVDQGLLDKNEVHGFFSEQVFIPGGIELGVFPTSFWIPRVMAMESVVRACIQRYPAREHPRTIEQARSWSFCMERLGSFMLLKYLRTNPQAAHWPTRYIGCLTLVTEEAGVGYVPGV